MDHRLHGLLAQRTAGVLGGDERFHRLSPARSGHAPRGQRCSPLSPPVRRPLCDDSSPGLRREARAHIWLSFSPDLIHWGSHHHPLARAARRLVGRQQDRPVLPPLETPEGWLILYHGVRMTAGGCLYRLGLALLDLEDPSRVLRRSDEWVFAPEMPYERQGDVSGVVFPCGWILDRPSGVDPSLLRGADTCLALATAQLSDVLELPWHMPWPPARGHNMRRIGACLDGEGDVNASIGMNGNTFRGIPTTIPCCQTANARPRLLERPRLPVTLPSDIRRVITRFFDPGGEERIAQHRRAHQRPERRAGRPVAGRRVPEVPHPPRQHRLRARGELPQGHGTDRHDGRPLAQSPHADRLLLDGGVFDRVGGAVQPVDRPASQPAQPCRRRGAVHHEPAGNGRGARVVDRLPHRRHHSRSPGQIDPCGRLARPVRVVPDKQYDKPLFRRKLNDIGVREGAMDLVLDRLADSFTLAQLEQAITEARAAARKASTRGIVRTSAGWPTRTTSWNFPGRRRPRRWSSFPRPATKATASRTCAWSASWTTTARSPTTAPARPSTAIACSRN